MPWEATRRPDGVEYDYYDQYRGRYVADGDPCDVCGSTNTTLVWVEDGAKPLCPDHEGMFGP